ncbi:MAG: riboflavin synthase [Micrococcaceae bacterium]
MFTGLVEETGRITRLDRLPDDALRITIDAPLVTADADHGASICVSGVCLTVVERDGTAFSADVMGQTLAVSSLADRTVGDPVNLERAVAGTTRLGGHVVQGHVDGVAVVSDIAPGEVWHTVRFDLGDPALAPLLVDKGSITIDGVSLTLSAVSAPEDDSPWFEVSLIPETLAATTLGGLEVGRRVNVETDILARHVARLLAFARKEDRA